MIILVKPMKKKKKILKKYYGISIGQYRIMIWHQTPNNRKYEIMQLLMTKKAKNTKYMQETSDALTDIYISKPCGFMFSNKYIIEI